MKLIIWVAVLVVSFVGQGWAQQSELSISRFEIIKLEVISDTILKRNISKKTYIGEYIIKFDKYTGDVFYFSSYLKNSKLVSDWFPMIYSFEYVIKNISYKYKYGGNLAVIIC